MSFKNFIIFTALFTFPLTTMAASGESSPFYIGLNGAKFDTTASDAGGTETSTNHDGFMVNMGYDLNNYLALEATAGTSSSTDDETTPGNSSKIDYTAGLYLRLNLRFDRVTLSFLAGRSSTRFSSTVGNTTTKSTESGTSTGIGLDFYGTRDLALSFRTMVLYEKDTPDGGKLSTSVSTFGITYYFDAPKIRSRY